MRILLIEDDKYLSETLSFQLVHAGFTVDSCENGEDALYYMKECFYDLILLDRMLPLIDGITVLKKFRSMGKNTPVILLTEDPFAFEELLARIRSISRRPKEWKADETLCFGDISYTPSTNWLCGPNESCTLSKKEGDLLETFLLNPLQTLPRATLLSKVWGIDADVEDGNLDNYMHFIRRRLKTVSNNVRIKTVRGIGYHLEDSAHV